jgi:hypothetical protein
MAFLLRTSILSAAHSRYELHRLRRAFVRAKPAAIEVLARPRIQLPKTASVIAAAIVLFSLIIPDEAQFDGQVKH